MVYTTEQLSQIILPILKKYSAQSALLFGSYARGQATHASDIDLLVIGGDRFDPTDVFCIADELHRATGKAVDVYELCELEHGSPFYNAVMSEGVQVA